MKTIAYSRSARGFSLLEVLVAIVILSVGLLALASLQLTLIRASNDTKAQTTAMSLAKEKIETLGAYEIMGGATACYSPAAAAVSGQKSCYRQITTQNSPVETINGVGGINYRRATTVARYVYKTASPAGFVTGGFTNIDLDTAVKAGCPTCLPGKEFKRVAVTVTWVDAGGVTGNVQVEDVIPGLSPADSLAVSSIDELTSPRKPTVIINNPASDPGVIPISLGDGTDTAATNPRPVIVSQGNDAQTVEVRYDIYTYAALSGDTATAQSRVELTHIGCRCTYGTGTTTAFRPTYWNGFEFKAPVTATGIPVSVPASGSSNQSDKCTACCRDHHDTDTSVAPLFDPRRTDHDHYDKADLTTAVTVGVGNSYDEACRLIRVDGIFRTAAEPYIDSFGMVPTANFVTSTGTQAIEGAVPGDSMEDAYESYVIAYLEGRFVDSTDYNTLLDDTTITGYSTLNTPANGSIDSTTDPQYLNARGLLIEYMNADAIAAVASAKAACVAADPDCTDAQLRTAVLKRLLFTSVNATELSEWTESDVSVVDVTYLEDFDDLSATLNVTMPVSGRVDHSGGTDGESSIVSAIFQRSSAGQAQTGKVFPDTELVNNMHTDTQNFVVGSGGSGSCPGGENTTLSISGGTAFLNAVTTDGGNPMQVDFGATEESCSPTTSSVTPFTCTTNTDICLGIDQPFRVSNYNRTNFVDPTLLQNACTQSGTGHATDTLPTGNGMPYRLVFGITSATAAGSTVTTPVVTNDGELSEVSTFTVSPLNVDQDVVLEFSAVSYRCPSNWAAYINNSGSEASPLPDNSGPDSLCTSGGTKVPKWDTVNPFITCPTGFAPFN